MGVGCKSLLRNATDARVDFVAHVLVNSSISPCIMARSSHRAAESDDEDSGSDSNEFDGLLDTGSFREPRWLG